MLDRSPPLLAHLDRIVSLASISSANKAIDMSNKAVIDYLGNELETLGFACEVVPCVPDAEKLNLIATYGSGPVSYTHLTLPTNREV